MQLLRKIEKNACHHVACSQIAADRREANSLTASSRKQSVDWKLSRFFCSWRKRTVESTKKVRFLSLMLKGFWMLIRCEFFSFVLTWEWLYWYVIGNSLYFEGYFKKWPEKPVFYFVFRSKIKSCEYIKLMIYEHE